MDVARTAVRRGAKEVSIMYRRGEEDMPASQHEIKYAKIDGGSSLSSTNLQLK